MCACVCMCYLKVLQLVIMLNKSKLLRYTWDLINFPVQQHQKKRRQCMGFLLILRQEKKKFLLNYLKQTAVSRTHSIFLTSSTCSLHFPLCLWDTCVSDYKQGFYILNLFCLYLCLKDNLTPHPGNCFPGSSQK